LISLTIGSIWDGLIELFASIPDCDLVSISAIERGGEREGRYRAQYRVTQFKSRKFTCVNQGCSFSI
jgi:hypothetical protein